MVNMLGLRDLVPERIADRDIEEDVDESTVESRIDRRDGLVEQPHLILTRSFTRTIEVDEQLQGASLKGGLVDQLVGAHGLTIAVI
jgi:hypothetical protein